jgi:hypothetical protein
MNWSVPVQSRGLEFFFFLALLTFELRASCPQSFIVLGVFEIGSRFWLGLALDCNSPDLCLLSSQDYRCEALHLAKRGRVFEMRQYLGL